MSAQLLKECQQFEDRCSASIQAAVNIATEWKIEVTSEHSKKNFVQILHQGPELDKWFAKGKESNRAFERVRKEFLSHAKKEERLPTQEQSEQFLEALHKSLWELQAWIDETSSTQREETLLKTLLDSCDRFVATCSTSPEQAADLLSQWCVSKFTSCPVIRRVPVLYDGTELSGWFALPRSEDSSFQTTRKNFLDLHNAPPPNRARELSAALRRSFPGVLLWPSSRVALKNSPSSSLHSARCPHTPHRLLSLSCLSPLSSLRPVGFTLNPSMPLS